MPFIVTAVTAIAGAISGVLAAVAVLEQPSCDWVAPCCCPMPAKP